MLAALDKILRNKYKDLFIVRLGTALTLANLGIVGVAAKVAAPFLSGFLGVLLEQGVFHIDLTLDAYKEGRKLKEFYEIAEKEYNNAVSKIHTEEEKQKIREQYLSIISKLGPI